MSRNRYSGPIDGVDVMKPNPIVNEIHEIREQLAARYDFDIDRMFEAARGRQVLSRAKIVSFENEQVETDEPNHVLAVANEVAVNS